MLSVSGTTMSAATSPSFAAGVTASNGNGTDHSTVPSSGCTALTAATDLPSICSTAIV